MITAPEAIAELMDLARRRVEINNLQPFRADIAVAETTEARAAELLSHYMVRVIDLLQANNRLLERARTAEAGVAAAVASEREEAAQRAYMATIYSGCPADGIAQEIADAVRMRGG